MCNVHLIGNFGWSYSPSAQTIHWPQTVLVYVTYGAISYLAAISLYSAASYHALAVILLYVEAGWPLAIRQQWGSGPCSTTNPSFPYIGQPRPLATPIYTQARKTHPLDAKQQDEQEKCRKNRPETYAKDTQLWTIFKPHTHYAHSCFAWESPCWRRPSAETGPGILANCCIIINFCPTDKINIIERALRKRSRRNYCILQRSLPKPRTRRSPASHRSGQAPPLTVRASPPKIT